MIRRLKQVSILLLILLIQLQPAITHATVLASEHAYLTDDNHECFRQHTDSSGSDLSIDQITDQSTDCHSVYELSPALSFVQDISLLTPFTPDRLSEKLVSIDLARTLPPPRHFVS